MPAEHIFLAPETALSGFATWAGPLACGASVASPPQAPRVMLRWSDDGGHTWSDYRIGSVGNIGQTALRVKFNRLGSTRINSGLDRIFELSSTDPYTGRLIGAVLET